MFYLSWHFNLFGKIDFLSDLKFDQIVKNPSVSYTKHTKNQENETIYVNAPQINLRTGPGTNYSEITKLSYGDVLGVIEAVSKDDGGTWIKVLTDEGRTGWLNQKFLTKTPPASAGERQLVEQRQKEVAAQEQAEINATKERQLTEQRQREAAAQEQAKMNATKERQLAEQRQREAAAQEQAEMNAAKERQLAEQRQREAGGTGTGRNECR